MQYAVLVTLVFTILISPCMAPGDEIDARICSRLMAELQDGKPAEMLLILAEQADLSGATAITNPIERRQFVYEHLWHQAQATQAPLVRELSQQGVTFRSFYIVNALLVEGDLKLARSLADRSEVSRIEANPRIMNKLPIPQEQQVRGPEGIEPGISYSHAPEVWAMGFTGQGIVVGIQDTGMQWDHPALKNQYRGWDGSAVSHDYNWHDSIHSGGIPACPPDSATPCDDYGHGTHVIGTAVGTDGGSNQIGMAPGAKWIGCRNMSSGVGTPATYLECFEFMLAPYPVGGTPAQGRPDLAPDVTVNSWGCPPSEGCAENVLLAALQAQRAAGIMTVVSAGNSGPSCSTVKDPPAHYDASYTVGALNSGADTLAGFSSRGPVTVDASNRLKPDLCARGTSVRSAYPTNAYASMDGTSMACPHVGGAVALLWSARPWLRGNLDATENHLNQSAVHIVTTDCGGASSWPNNLFGYGRLDVQAAVLAAPTCEVDYPGDINGDCTVNNRDLLLLMRDWGKH